MLNDIVLNGLSSVSSQRVTPVEIFGATAEKGCASGKDNQIDSSKSGHDHHGVSTVTDWPVADGHADLQIQQSRSLTGAFPF